MKGTEQNGKHAWMAFGSICVMCIVWIGIAYKCMGLYADPVTADLGITRSQFMLVMTVVVATNALVNLFAYGTIEERLGIRKILVTGGLLATAALVVWSQVQNLAMLYLGGFLFGLAMSMLTNNTVATAISHWFKRKMGTYISLANTFGSISGIIFAIVIAALIAAVGWRTGFLVTAIISAAATIVVFLLYKGDPEDLGERPLYADDAETASEGADGCSYKRMLKAPTFWLLGVTYLCSGLICYGLFGSLALFAVDFGYADSQGLMVSIALLASTITMVPFGALCDKIGTKWMLAICMVCMIVAGVALQMDSLPVVALFAVAAIIGAGYNANNVPMGVSVMEAFGSLEYSKKLGVVIAFNFAGVAFGPTVLSLFYDMTGSFDSGLMLYMVLAAVVVIGGFVGTRRIGKSA